MLKIFVAASDEKAREPVMVALASYQLCAGEGDINTCIDAMNDADICVLVLPSDSTAHTEAGYMCGEDKVVFVYDPKHNAKDIHQLFNGTANTLDELSYAVAVEAANR